MRLPQIRRFGLTAFAAALIAATAPWVEPARVVAAESPAPPSLITLRVGEPTDPLPLLAAIDRGYFARQGLAIQLVRIGSAPANIAALVGGDEDIVYGDTITWALAIGKGIDLTIFQACNGGDAPQAGGVTTLLVNPASGIHSAADLRGRQIGVTTSALTALLVKLWLKRNGVDPNSVTLRPMNSSVALGTALDKGFVDAATNTEPFTEEAMHDHGFVPIGYPSRETPRGTARAAFFSTNAWLNTHADAARGFAIAIRAGARWANAAGADEKAALLAKFTPLDLAALEARVPGIVKQFHYDYWVEGAIDERLTQRWVDVAVKNGLLKNSIIVKDHLYPTALARTLR